jgi:uncharacterized protein (DUF433 family)
MNAVIRDDPPLWRDEAGAWRVGNTRVLLELVIRAYKRKESPEIIVERYPTLALADVHAVIAYYLRHTEDVEEYLRECEEKAAEARRLIEANQPARPGFREELEARLARRSAEDASPAQ